MRHEDLDAATTDLDPPFAVVYMPAYEANALDLVRRAAGKPIRLASKSGPTTIRHSDSHHPSLGSCLTDGWSLSE